MVREHPVASAAAKRIVFDALDNPASVGPVVELGPIKVIGLVQLDLHRGCQAVTGPAATAKGEHFAAFDHFPHGQSGEAMEISVPIGISGRRPALSEIVSQLV